ATSAPAQAAANVVPSPQWEVSVGTPTGASGDSQSPSSSSMSIVNRGIPADEPPARTGQGELATPGQNRLSHSTVQRAKVSPSRAAELRDRKGFVAARRVGPPYDTKVLRGRIREGRLIINSQDRRGITIY